MSMLKNLPKAYRDTEMAVDLDQAGSIGEIDATEISKQILLDSMTWQIPVEERIAGVETNSADLNFRRDALRLKWHSNVAKGDLAGLQAIIDAYRDHGITASYAYPVITVSFADTGVPYDIERLQTLLREMAPAHLRIDYDFNYRRQNQVAAYTHQQLHAFMHWEIKENEIL